MLWIFVVGIFAVTVLALGPQVSKTKFSCDGRTTGYYADVESGCQVYHMCDGLGRQFSYTCPNATLFQQRMLICDHWYMVNCSKSVQDYTANLRIGQKMPFVDDSETNPYYRTPRPDLLSQRSQSEYDIIYRTGRAQFNNNINLVGVDTDFKRNKTTSTTDEPAYSLPSHWSTEYNQQLTTNKPIFKIIKKIGDNTSILKGKPILPGTTTDGPVVNYKSYYKNTTPVFPRTVDVSTASPDDVGLVPPLPYQLLNNTNSNPEPPATTTEPPPPTPSTEAIQVNFKSDFKATTPVYPKIVEPAPSDPPFEPPVNFYSNFKATTPVYPKTVELASSDPLVNFRSDFKATTPVYPKFVEATSVDPGDLGIQPPDNPNNSSAIVNPDVPVLSLDILPPPESFNFQQHNKSQEEVAVPSKFYQPPKFSPDYTDQVPQSQENSVLSKRGGVKAFNSDDWENLRKEFSIPDYDFPLESVSPPSYDSVLSSFGSAKKK